MSDLYALPRGDGEGSSARVEEHASTDHRDGKLEVRLYIDFILTQDLSKYRITGDFLKDPRCKMWWLLFGQTRAITVSSTIRMQALTSNVILGEPDLKIRTGDFNVPDVLFITVHLL